MTATMLVLSDEFSKADGRFRVSENISQGINLKKVMQFKKNPYSSMKKTLLNSIFLELNACSGIILFPR